MSNLIWKIKAVMQHNLTFLTSARGKGQCPFTRWQADCLVRPSQPESRCTREHRPSAHFTRDHSHPQVGPEGTQLTRTHITALDTSQDHIDRCNGYYFKNWLTVLTFTDGERGAPITRRQAYDLRRTYQRVAVHAAELELRIHLRTLRIHR